MSFLKYNGQMVQNSGKYLSNVTSPVYSDWFLPSLDELNQMNDNLKVYSVGNFADADYWCSSESAANSAWMESFIGGSGAQKADAKSDTLHVRACRTFSGAGTYSLRDTGPGGGLVFYIDGGTYYEAYATDQSTSQAWSNITGTAVGGTGTAIGTGLNNTSLIMAQSGHTNSAAKVCDDLN